MPLLETALMRWPAASTARRGLTVLFAINAVGAGAAAVVLALAPGAIPSTAGIAIDPSQNLLPYLLAAAELALASLAALAIRSPSTEVKRISVGVLVIFHAASAGYSHSIVAGGFPEMSYTTRETPGTSFTIRSDT